MAQHLADAYGVSLAVVGLLTTALFVTHLAAQLPAGRGSDRLGARSVALLAVAAVVVGNLVLVSTHAVVAAAAGRAIVGLGSGGGFVAGLDLVRAGGGGVVAQGLYGGATMTGGGLALMTLPRLTDAMSWRAPYWSAIALALLAAVPTLGARNLPRIGHRGSAVLRDSQLLPLGALAAGTFGLSVIAGNWVVTLLEREGASATVAGIAGGTTLFAGILTRPGGGIVLRRDPRRGRATVGASIVLGALGAGALAAGVSLALSTAGALLLGLAAGMAFAPIIDATLRLRPDAPAAAVGAVNGCAILAVVVGTPLTGLTFSLPGDGRIGFAAIAALWAAGLLVLPRAPLARHPANPG